MQSGLIFDHMLLPRGRHSIILEWLGLGFMGVSEIPGASPLNTEHADGQEDEDEVEGEEEEEDELIHIPEEAELIQAERVIDGNELKMRNRKKEDADIAELANTLLAMNLNKKGNRGAQPMLSLIHI